MIKQLKNMMIKARDENSQTSLASIEKLYFRMHKVEFLKWESALGLIYNTMTVHKSKNLLE